MKVKKLLVLSVLFTLFGCKDLPAPKKYVTVTQEEWTTAMNFAAKTNYKVNMWMYTTEHGIRQTTYRQAGKLAEITYEGSSNSMVYYDKSDETSYKYTYDAENDTYSKTEDASIQLASEQLQSLFGSITYNANSWNEEDQCYVYSFTDTILNGDYGFYFDDAKLAQVKWRGDIVGSPDHLSKVTIASYNKMKVRLPALDTDNGITKQSYAKLINRNDYKLNYLLEKGEELVSIESDDTSDCFQYKFNGNKCVINDCYNDEFVSPSYVEYIPDNSSDMKYAYISYVGWYKATYSGTNPIYGGVAYNVVANYSYDDLVYDEEMEIYKFGAADTDIGHINGGFFTFYEKKVQHIYMNMSNYLDYGNVMIDVDLSYSDQYVHLPSYR